MLINRIMICNRIVRIDSFDVFITNIADAILHKEWVDMGHFVFEKESDFFEGPSYVD